MQTWSRSPVTLLHTADLHIDEGQASITAMRAVIDIALAERVNLVLIAGDTFDHDQVSDLAARSVVTELARLTQPVVIIPGNHDPIDYRSIYRRVDLTEAGPHVYFVDDPAGRELVFPDLNSPSGPGASRTTRPKTARSPATGPQTRACGGSYSSTAFTFRPVRARGTAR